jgi:Uma2 family endonuclease
MAVEVERTRRLFSVDEYERMVEVGILTRQDHVELIHGEIVEMTPIGRGHFAAASALHAFFVERLGRRVVVGAAGSLRVPPHSMPEPDLMLLVPRADFYRGADLRPEDVLLLIEVADTSLRYDRVVKGPLYAAAGVAEYWIVDVDGGAVEVYRDPIQGHYRSGRRITRGQSFGPQAFPELLLSVADILG